VKSSFPYLFWAYNLIWLGLAGYLAFMFNRMRRLERRLDRLGKSDRPVDD
jgi:CcmD family protein